LYLIYCQISPLITPLTAKKLGYVAEREKEKKQKEITKKLLSRQESFSCVHLKEAQKVFQEGRHGKQLSIQRGFDSS